MKIMKNFFKLFVLLALILPGCVFINLPTPEPLVEKTIGGKGADKIALIDVSGIIEEEYDEPFLFEANITARIKEELTLAERDKNIRALVLRINSPGGSVTTCDIIYHEIKNFKKKKNIPVVAELMDVAASGGYYIASAADKIVAHPTTVTGSIGVVAYSINATGLMEKIGIKDQTIKSGDKKDMGSPLRKMTEEERKILQSVIDGLHERFIDVIAESRKGLGREDIKKLADGRIFTAQQALEQKLVDRTGYMDDSLELAKELAGIREATLVTYATPGAYKNNVYSAIQALRPPQVNLINIGNLPRTPGIRFMYLWLP